jgi:hypothetical protein
MCLMCSAAPAVLGWSRVLLLIRIHLYVCSGGAACALGPGLPLCQGQWCTDSRRSAQRVHMAGVSQCAHVGATCGAVSVLSGACCTACAASLLQLCSETQVNPASAKVLGP